MNLFSKCYCRFYQGIMRVAQSFLKFEEPELHEGNNTCADVPAILKKRGFLRPLIITDPGVYSLGLTASLEEALKKAGVSYSIYSKVVANPTFDVIIEAKALAGKDNCDCLIAVGGGSSIDTAKAAGALLADPKATLPRLKGLLKVHRRYPLLIAIPTTAGTGSETTVAAVVVNPKTHEKFSINDPRLIPQVAILDSSLLKKLPPNVIASTGMDALTHAVESYIGHSGTRKTEEYAIAAVRLIHNSLYAFYENPADGEARGEMQKAAYLAGFSFTRAYIGYVHAIAHSLGGQYNVPHGLANAIILPYVLRRYGKKAEKPLAELSDAVGLTGKSASAHEKAASFIAWIEQMNSKMAIPTVFSGVIKKDDIPLLSLRAAKEANPLYPVPKEMNAKELAEIYKEID
jgi:alcohol dehydrogenase